MSSLRLRAHAKINLDLRVGPKRADGFHGLTTVIQSVALHDTLTFRAVAGPCQVRCATPGVPSGRDNLIWRVMDLLWASLGHGGEPSGVQVRVVKRIPIAAGLGGGTANAIAALLGLCQLWEVSPEPDRLFHIAAEVGADGPFFLVGGTALGIGRGDEVYPLPDLDRHWVVLAVPPRGVSTAVAYDWLDRDRAVGEGDCGAVGTNRRRPPVAEATLDLEAFRNDLESSVVRRRSELRPAIRHFQEHGALRAAMTGSGSAVFGLFSQRRTAREAARAMSLTGWTVIETSTVDRTRLRPLAVT